jgi:hypothetical protein
MIVIGKPWSRFPELILPPQSSNNDLQILTDRCLRLPC